ncbi:MAG: cation diffusion facilitator family transporter [Desulfobacterales bacterium]|jgi:cation diffusion facilitator family transporter
MSAKEHASRLEQRTLTLSIGGVLTVAVGSIAYGLYLKSDVVILNGIFSLFSLIGAGLSLLAAKLVVKPEDRRFPFGYSHVEPLVLSVNGFMVLVICVYALINGLEGIRAGGNPVDTEGVIWFSLVSGAVCLAVWVYERRVARRIDSLLVAVDAREWLIDFGFSLVTLLGFAVLAFLEEPHRGVWARYADPVMVSVMALLAIPTPVRVLQRSLREVLLMAVADDAVTRRLEAVLEAVRAEHDIVRYVHHVVKTGRTRFIEVDIVVGPNFSLQTVAQQDRMRERIWRALELPLEDAWLSICLTEDPRWV